MPHIPLAISENDVKSFAQNSQKLGELMMQLKPNNETERSLEEILRLCQQEPRLIKCAVPLYIVDPIDDLCVPFTPFTFLIREGATREMIESFIETHYETVQNDPIFRYNNKALESACRSWNTKPGIVAYLIEAMNISSDDLIMPAYNYSQEHTRDPYVELCFDLVKKGSKCLQDMEAIWNLAFSDKSKHNVDDEEGYSIEHNLMKASFQRNNGSEVTNFLVSKYLERQKHNPRLATLKLSLRTSYHTASVSSLLTLEGITSIDIAFSIHALTDKKNLKCFFDELKKVKTVTSIKLSFWETFEPRGNDSWEATAIKLMENGICTSSPLANLRLEGNYSGGFADITNIIAAQIERPTMRAVDTRQFLVEPDPVIKSITRNSKLRHVGCIKLPTKQIVSLSENEALLDCLRDDKSSLSSLNLPDWKFPNSDVYFFENLNHLGRRSLLNDNTSASDIVRLLRPQDKRNDPRVDSMCDDQGELRIEYIHGLIRENPAAWCSSHHPEHSTSKNAHKRKHSKL